MTDLQPYQLVILILAIWLVVALIVQIPFLIRSARTRADWEVVAFRASLLFLALTVALRYVFDLSPWLIAFGWLVLDLAATGNTLYIWRRMRERRGRES